MKYTEEEIQIAKSVDLCEVAKALGYTVKRRGHHHVIREMDSLIIYDRRSWCRWSRRGQKEEAGGSQIDFLRVFMGLGFADAVSWLLAFSGYQKSEDVNLKYMAPKAERKEKREFQLPPPASHNNRLYSYLMKERCLSKEIIDYFVQAGLIYESKPYHNVVFKGLDKEGNCRFASMRGTFDKDGKSFKGDVEGNDKTYGFNVVREDSKRVYVFEAAIDLMSYMDIHGLDKGNMLALGMLSDAPLETFLQEHPEITEIVFCLDNDIHGRNATKELLKKYYERGYDVEDAPPLSDVKDMNEWLVKNRNFSKVVSESNPKMIPQQKSGIKR